MRRARAKESAGEACGREAVAGRSRERSGRGLSCVPALPVRVSFDRPTEPGARIGRERRTRSVQPCTCSSRSPPGDRLVRKTVPRLRSITDSSRAGEFSPSGSTSPTMSERDDRLPEGGSRVEESAHDGGRYSAQQPIRYEHAVSALGVRLKPEPSAGATTGTSDASVPFKTSRASARAYRAPRGNRGTRRGSRPSASSRCATRSASRAGPVSPGRGRGSRRGVPGGG